MISIRCLLGRHDPRPVEEISLGRRVVVKRCSRCSKPFPCQHAFRFVGWAELGRGLLDKCILCGEPRRREISAEDAVARARRELAEVRSRPPLDRSCPCGGEVDEALVCRRCGGRVS